MSQPSEKAADIAEALVDYIHPGMPRGAAIREIAAMIDSMNTDLLEVITALLREADANGPCRHAVLLNHLRSVVAAYKPVRTDVNGQHELFSSETNTATGIASTVAGQMP